MDTLSTYVINLKRRPDRLKAFQDSSPVAAAVFYGFDAKNEIVNPMPMIQCRKPGEIGCFISHLQIYETIVKEGHTWTLLLEDDAIFCDQFKEKLSGILHEISTVPTPQIIYIGGRFEPNFVMKSICATKVTDHIAKHRVSQTRPWQPVDHDRTTHAYLLSLEGAATLLNAFRATTNPIQIPVDYWILQTFLSRHVPIYNSVPLLCHSPMVGDSDIR